MRIQSTIRVLLILLFLFIAGAAADTIQVQNVRINTVGDTTPVEIILDTSTNGVAGYDISITLSDPSVASITEVTFPSWAMLNESSSLPASSVRLRMVDLDNKIIPGSTEISFGSIILQGDAIGSTDVEITIKEITSDYGDSLSPSVDSGRLIVGAARTTPIIANHTTIDLSKIPRLAINNSKDNLHIAYGHTSHGSQIVDGMSGLVDFANAPYGGSTYAWNNGGTGDALDFRDDMGNYGNPYYGGAEDLGQPNLTAWPGSTRLYLQAHPEVNVIMWSWCGQVSGLSDAQLNYYLTSMNTLESEYPDVHFVYMTGHLDGSGESGTLNANNEKIRAYALANNKILFDFADIESYDPDGLVNYMKLNANDNCDYTIDSVSHNWATEWQTAHTEGVDWYDMDPLPQHTQALNANKKAYAAWWLWARLGGWDGTPEIVTTSNIGLYQKSTGMFRLKNSNRGGAADNTFRFGWAGNDDLVPLAGDWDGSGTDTIGLYQKSTGIFRLKNSNSGGVADNTFRSGWAGNGDLVPLVGDWDGNGVDTIGLYQDSTGIFRLKNSNNGGAANKQFIFGWAGNDDLVPLVGQWQI